MVELWDRIGRMSNAKRALLLSKLPAAVFEKLAVAMPAFAFRMTVDQLSAEARLEPSIDPQRAAPPSMSQSSVLLTGATGFVGAFLLQSLFEGSAATIYCLVRASGVLEASQRIRDNAIRYSLPEPQEQRLVPVPGDLEKSRLGLDNHWFDELSERVDCIYHCGAQVNWIYPYRRLHGANVHGTHEILRLATSRRLKPVHFVSTVGVFSSPEYPTEIVSETEPLENSGALYVGYAQTKWVAEKLVRLAAARGLPVAIYRPNVASHSGTGAFNAADHVNLMLQGCIQLNLAPDLDMRIDGAPVDFVADAIVKLAARSNGATYHLVNGSGIAWNDFVSWHVSKGYRITSVPYADWRIALQKAIHSGKENALRGLSPFFSDSPFSFARLANFACDDTMRVLSDLGVVC
ncbi:MAG TPA: thioester reductase domain-containing protein, partial [Terracidiphilus sp.]|nr:thioester reductase domain-containing protein [Terracidiphilus sp.]